MEALPQPAAQGRRKEDAHIAELERRTRAFVDWAATYPPQLFATGTREFIEDAGRLLAQLDDTREKRRSSVA